MSGGTHDHATSCSIRRRLRDSHPLRSPVPAVFGCLTVGDEVPAGPSSRLVQPSPRSGGSLVRMASLGSSRFARRYYGNRLCSSGYVRCFSSPGSLPAWTGCQVSPLTGCPIRRSPDRRLPASPRCISPRGRVLHRPGAPRHPPCALLWFFSHRRSRRCRLRGARGDACRHHPRCIPSGAASSSVKVRSYRPSWSRGDSNPGPPPCKGGALPTKLRPPPRVRDAFVPPCRVGAPGLEPGTSALSGPRSNQLSYAPVGRVHPTQATLPALCRRRSNDRSATRSR